MAAATYVYCVIRSARKPALARLPAGLPGAEGPQLAEVDAGMWLVLATVPLDRYGPGPLEESLRDLQWVSSTAVAHEAVVEHFAQLRGVTVIPMKLFSMFSSPARAIAEMRRRRRRLAALFDKFHGCEEWGVRILRGTPRLPGKAAGKAGERRRVPRGPQAGARRIGRCPARLGRGSRRRLRACWRRLRLIIDAVTGRRRAWCRRCSTPHSWSRSAAVRGFGRPRQMRPGRSRSRERG